MLQVIVALVGGAVVGWLLPIRKRLGAGLEAAVSASIYLLLFLMGVAVGINRQVMTNLPALGLQGLILAVAGIMGSIAVARIGERVFSAGGRK